MKALSLVQPYASLIAAGAKQFETRSRGTSYRGPLAIHASKTRGGEWEQRGREIRGRFPELLPDELWNDPPRGVILCVAELEDVVATDEIAGTISEVERACGDYGPGRWAWKLRNVRVLPVAVPARGRHFLWDLEAEVQGLVKTGTRLRG